MNEEELRALVREAIQRHLEGREPLSASLPEERPRLHASHPSHFFLKVAPGSAVDEGMCLIEPAVRCNHCGFCQSYGH